VAVGLERPHPQLLGQSKGLAIVGFGLIILRRLAPRRNVAEEAQGIGLVAAFLALTGKRERPLDQGVRLPQAARQHLRLSQGETTGRLSVYYFHCNRPFQRSREQRPGVGDAPA
jgi:hypothetical protein